MKNSFIILVSFLIFCGNSFAQVEKLSLEDCINIALKANPNIKINSNLNESADEDVLGSYSGILPNIDLSANSGRAEAGDKTVEGDIPVGFDSTANQAVYVRGIYTQPGYISNFNSVNLRVSQNLFDGGEWWNAIKYAKSQKRSSDFNFTSVVNQTVRSVHERFFDLAKQQKLLEVRELAVKRSEDQLNKTQKMFELGSVAKVDVYRSKVNYGNDKISLLQQKNAVMTAKNNLNLVMGRDPHTPIAIETDLTLTPIYESVEEMHEESVKNNPVLKKYKEDFISADLNSSRSYASVYPSLAAFFNYSRSHEEFDRVYGEFDKNWNTSYGLSLSFNLFNGFQDKVRIQKSKLAARNAQESYEDYKRTLKANIAQLTDSYNAYLEIIQINEENLVAAKEEYRLAEERYRIGSGTALEVREAQVNLTQAEQTLVAAQYNARIVQAQIEENLGSIHKR